MFESIPQAVPDSYLLTKAAYRAGEAWYQASSCPEATAWFAKAVELNDKELRNSQAHYFGKAPANCETTIYGKVVRH